jgi:serine/threonine protein kinase
MAANCRASTRSPLEQMLLDGSKPIDDTQDPLAAYEVVSAVGRGKFSTVYKAYRKVDNTVVAQKRIRMGDVKHETAAKCLQEVQLLQSLNHRNIIHYLDSFACHPNTLVIVLEWATDGDLQHHLKRIKSRGGSLPEPVIWSSFVQICEALAHMHERRILHRDLKPANIFLHSDGTIKVGDLGLGRALSDHTPEAFSKVGTPLYMSPEALKGDGYDMKSDIWSLGCVLYELATLVSPFKEDDLKMFQLFQKIVKGDYSEWGGWLLGQCWGSVGAVLGQCWSTVVVCPWVGLILFLFVLPPVFFACVATQRFQRFQDRCRRRSAKI